MSLLDALRAGVKVADSVTKPLQATVTYYKAVPDTSGYGTFTYPTAVTLRAIVDFARKQVRTREGILTVTRATIDLLDVAAVVAATGGEGIGNDDRFVLPDGDTGPILDISGFIDAGTGQPIATTVMLG
jgi:hypothetical protein